MYALLLVLSIVSTAVGVCAIGFGVPNHEFGLGNTLIVSGSVAIVGGMLTFGLAVAVRQLRRVVDALGQRPVPAPAPRRQPGPETAEGAPPPRRPPGPPVPYPPRPDAREPRPEIRPAPPPPPAPVMEAPEPPPMERPRPSIFGVGRAPGEPPIVDEPDTVPLAPNRTPAAPIGRGGPPPMPERMPERMPEPPPEPRAMPEPRPASPAEIMARLANLASTPQRPAPPPRPEPPRAPAPASERSPEARPRQNMFDTLWPAEVRATRQSQSETIARAPKQEARPESKPDARPEPKVDVQEPKRDFRAEPESRPELRFEPPMPREPMTPPPAEQRPIAILKSGVIDGMAYTLYTDGSIEAELPQGTMRFGSIDELRTHLEKTERQD